MRAALLLALLIPAAPTLADQGSTCMPTAGTVSGLTFAQDVNAGLKALLTTNSGNSAPANDCSLAALKGQLWLDTSTSPNVLKIYDGTSWLALGSVDTSSHLWNPPIGGGASSIASSTTTSIFGASQSLLTVTGTSSITGFGSGVAGQLKVLKFAAALTLTYNATSLILPTAANITTAAGDQAIVISLGGTNASVIAYQRADGSPLANNPVVGANIKYTGIVSPTALSATTNDWAPPGLATASTIRADLSGNQTLTGLSSQPTGTEITLINVNASAILTLAAESASSSAANRFSLPQDFALGPKASAILRYDGTLSRWLVIASQRPGSTTAQALAGSDDTTAMSPADVKTFVLQGYQLKTFNVITSSGTYTLDAATRAILLEGVGGGGGGGGADSSSTDAVATGGGGGSGAYCFGWFVGLTGGTSYSVTIGAAGPGGANTGATGTTGGTTSFGALLSAPGGTGGNGRSSGGSGYWTAAGGPGGTGGTLTGAAAGYCSTGNAGTLGDSMYCCSGGDEAGGAGTGAPGPWGGGARATYGRGSTSVAGTAASGPGAGGSGATVVDNTTGQAGGNGFRGEIHVYEFQ